LLTGIFRFQEAIIKLLHTALQKNIYNFVIIFLQLLDGHAGSAIKVLVAIHYSVLDARNGYIRNVVV